MAATNAGPVANQRSERAEPDGEMVVDAFVADPRGVLNVSYSHGAKGNSVEDQSWRRARG